MFSDQHLVTLEEAGAVVAWRCNPILDIDLEGNVVHCYPLAGLGTLPLTETSNAAELRRAFAEWTRPYRRAGVFKECGTCRFKAKGECTGGCLAVTMRRFRKASFSLQMAAADADSAVAGRPRLAA
jgi:radical SAM protein with 4Fe4S-binding SPASM domain